MFDARPENKKAVEKAFKGLERMGRGDSFTHEQGANWFGLPPPSSDAPLEARKYYQMIDKLKKKMEEERGISLSNIPLVGYLLCRPKQQLELGLIRTRRAGRQIRKGQKSVECLPADVCSFHEQRARLAMIDTLALTERSMRQQAQQIAFHMRPRDANPRIAPPDDDEAETA